MSAKPNTNTCKACGEAVMQPTADLCADDSRLVEWACKNCGHTETRALGEAGKD